MASSDAKVCNRALTHLGIRGEYIDALDEDTESAGVFNEIYEDTRDACLAAFPWPFATLRRELAQKADEPPRDGWEYVFTAPNDCLTPRKIREKGMSVRTVSSDCEVRYEIEKSSTDDTSVILCDLEHPVLFYTAKFKDPTRFPPLFVDALSYLLAFEACLSLTGKEAKKEAMRLAYNQKIREAQVAAFNARKEDAPPETESIQGRK